MKLGKLPELILGFIVLAGIINLVMSAIQPYFVIIGRVAAVTAIIMLVAGTIMFLKRIGLFAWIASIVDRIGGGGYGGFNG